MEFCQHKACFMILMTYNGSILRVILFHFWENIFIWALSIMLWIFTRINWTTAQVNPATRPRLSFHNNYLTLISVSSVGMTHIISYHTYTCNGMRQIWSIKSSTQSCPACQVQLMAILKYYKTSATGSTTLLINLCKLYLDISNNYGS